MEELRLHLSDTTKKAGIHVTAKSEWMRIVSPAKIPKHRMAIMGEAQSAKRDAEAVALARKIALAAWYTVA